MITLLLRFNTQVPLEFIFKTLRDADIFIKNNIGPGEVELPLSQCLDTYVSST